MCTVGSFTSTELMRDSPIVKLDPRGHFLAALGGGIFTVPHGISIDGKGYLWATDVGCHSVFKLHPKTGKVRCCGTAMRIPMHIPMRISMSVPKPYPCPYPCTHPCP